MCLYSMRLGAIWILLRCVEKVDQCEKNGL
jgi:hypothetical protein